MNQQILRDLIAAHQSGNKKLTQLRLVKATARAATERARRKPNSTQDPLRSQSS
jgi:hypothetical protein